MIDHKTVHQIFELADKLFHEGIAWRKKEEELRERWYQKLGMDSDEYKEWDELSRSPLPFFIHICVIKQVVDDTKELENGQTMTLTHFEWDYSGAEAFEDGIQWAKDNGLVIPTQ